MSIELPSLCLPLLNGLGIPVVHLAIARWSVRRPLSEFDPTSFPYRIFSFERSEKIYLRYFRIRSWKHRLPDAGPLFGGFAKGNVRSKDPEYLRAFVLETCRGEQSHWLQFFAISSFVLWTPFPAAFAILAWAALANLPCILNLRHTRLRILRFLPSSK